MQCAIHACPGGGSTTISGRIYDPGGKNPLYGVVAYVPNATPAPITPGASCVSCDALYTGSPIAAAISDAGGNFTISKAPDGSQIPLVIQIGKWRRQFTIPSVTLCADTPLPDKSLTLPKNGTEGDMPEIAVSTGGADTLECVLARMGVDKAEYVPGASTGGHIHIFQGAGTNKTTNPPAPVSSAALWDTDADIMKYDLTLLACEGLETSNMKRQVLFDYTTSCGRVFASHFQYAWFNTGPFAPFNLATRTTGTNPISSNGATVVTSFPLGAVFNQWLQNVGALTNGEVQILAPHRNADLSASNTNSQAWLVADASSQFPGTAQGFSFDTPLGTTGPKLGRVAYSEVHVDYGVLDYINANGPTPVGCVDQDLTAQEKVVEFTLFNLSSCETPGGGLQQPPAVL